MKPLQGYFEIEPRLILGHTSFGMVGFAVEMQVDPGMTLDVIGKGNGFPLRTLENGNLLVLGAYSHAQYEALDGVVPECFICQEYEELMKLRPELDIMEQVEDRWVKIISNCRFAQ